SIRSGSLSLLSTLIQILLKAKQVQMDMDNQKENHSNVSDEAYKGWLSILVEPSQLLPILYQWIEKGFDTLELYRYLTIGFQIWPAAPFSGGWDAPRWLYGDKNPSLLGLLRHSPLSLDSALQLFIICPSTIRSTWSLSL